MVSPCLPLDLRKVPENWSLDINKIIEMVSLRKSNLEIGFGTK